MKRPPIFSGLRGSNAARIIASIALLAAGAAFVIVFLGVIQTQTDGARWAREAMPMLFVFGVAGVLAPIVAAHRVPTPIYAAPGVFMAAAVVFAIFSHVMPTDAIWVGVRSTDRSDFTVGLANASLVLSGASAYAVILIASARGSGAMQVVSVTAGVVAFSLALIVTDLGAESLFDGDRRRTWEMQQLAMMLQILAGMLLLVVIVGGRLVRLPEYGGAIDRPESRRRCPRCGHESVSGGLGGCERCGLDVRVEAV